MRFVSNKDTREGEYRMRYLRDFMIFSRREGEYGMARILILCPKNREGDYVIRISFYYVDESERVGKVSVYFNNRGCRSNSPMIEISSYEICRSLYKSLERFCMYGIEIYLLRFLKGLSEVSRSPLEKILRKICHESSYG